MLCAVNMLKILPCIHHDWFLRLYGMAPRSGYYGCKLSYYAFRVSTAQHLDTAVLPGSIYGHLSGYIGNSRMQGCLQF